jgi:hypothetical protein
MKEGRKEGRQREKEILVQTSRRIVRLTPASSFDRKLLAGAGREFELQREAQ